VPDDRCDLLCLDLPRAEEIRNRLDLDAIALAAGRARALADPTRFTVAVALGQGSEPCVCDLAWIAGRAESLIGHHLRALDRWRSWDSGWVGIALSVSSIAVMPLLGQAKKRIGARLGSAVTAGEGTQNLRCAYMAAGVLVGLLANTLLGAWWLDPAIALAIAAIAIHEGIETRRGNGCACAAVLGLDDAPDTCQDDGCP